MHTSQVTLVLPLVAAIAGCANPEVIYSQAGQSDTDGAIKFKFAHSMLVTTAQTDKNNNVTGYTIQSVPVASTSDPKFAISGAPWYRNWGVGTTLNATYIDDSSDLLKEIGVSVQDNRVTAIQDLGSVAAAVAAMAAEGAGTAPQQPPKDIDVTALLAMPTDQCKMDGTDILCHTTVDSYGWSATVRINPLPTDSFTLASSAFPYPTNSYLYSACRTAQVALLWSKDGTAGSLKSTVTVGNNTIILPSATVEIADPSAYEALAFPPSGKVDARTSCGAESTASSSNTSSLFDVVSALAKAAQSAKDAADGKTTPPASSTR